MELYIVTNTVNGKQYVGKTTQTPSRRWARHCSDARQNRYPNVLLHKALRKYGTDKFEVATIASLPTKDILNEAEQVAIRLLGTHVTKGGYNLTDGGDGFSGKRTEEWCRNTSQRMMGNKFSLGHIQSESTREKMRLAKLGTHQSEQTRNKRSVAIRKFHDAKGYTILSHKRWHYKQPVAGCSHCIQEKEFHNVQYCGNL